MLAAETGNVAVVEALRRAPRNNVNLQDRVR